MIKIISVLLLICIVGYFLLPNLLQRYKPGGTGALVSPTTHPKVLAPVEKLDGTIWTVYSDEVITFSYPKAWKVEKNKMGGIVTITSPNYKTEEVGEAGAGGAVPTIVTQGNSLWIDTAPLDTYPTDAESLCQIGGSGATKDCELVTVNGLTGYRMTLGTSMPDTTIVFHTKLYIFKSQSQVIKISLSAPEGDTATQSFNEQIVRSISFTNTK